MEKQLINPSAQSFNVLECYERIIVTLNSLWKSKLYSSLSEKQFIAFIKDISSKNRLESIGDIHRIKQLIQDDPSAPLPWMFDFHQIDINYDIANVHKGHLSNPKKVLLTLNKFDKAMKDKRMIKSVKLYPNEEKLFEITKGFNHIADIYEKDPNLFLNCPDPFTVFQYDEKLLKSVKDKRSRKITLSYNGIDDFNVLVRRSKRPNDIKYISPMALELIADEEKYLITKDYLRGLSHQEYALMDPTRFKAAMRFSLWQEKGKIKTHFYKAFVDVHSKYPLVWP